MIFTKKTNAETSTLEDVKNAILSELGNENPGTDKYEKLLSELERVCKLIHQDPTWSFKPSADAILNGSITALIALISIKHEAVNVITSKAWGLMPKLIK